MGGARSLLLRGGLILALVLVVASRLDLGNRATLRPGAPLEKIGLLARQAGYEDVEIAEGRWGDVRGGRLVRGYDPDCAGEVSLDVERITAVGTPRETPAGFGKIFYYGDYAGPQPGVIEIVREVARVEGRYMLGLAPQRPMARMVVVTAPERCLGRRADFSSLWAS